MTWRMRGARRASSRSSREAEVRLAARLHDVGWRSWEAAPELNPSTGRPENFLDVDVARHLVFYQAAVDEVAARDRYAGMLVSKHAAGIYTGRYGTQPRHDRHARAGAAGGGRRVRGPPGGVARRRAARARRERRGALAQLPAAAGLRPALAVAVQGRSGRHREDAGRRCPAAGSSRSCRLPRAVRSSRTRWPTSP